MEFKTGFFKRRVYITDTNAIHKKVYSWWGLFHKQSEDESIDFADIKYIDKMERGRCWFVWLIIYIFCLGKEELMEKHRNGLLHLTGENTSFYIPRTKLFRINALILELEEKGAQPLTPQFTFTPSKKAQRKLYKNPCLIKEEFNKIALKVFENKEVAIEKVKPENVVYYDDLKENGLQGIAFGSLPGGGAANSIDVFGLTNEENEIIHQYILNSGSKLGQEELVAFTSMFPIFKPRRWFKPREVLLLTDFGLIHKFYNGKRSRTSVVVFEKIKFYKSSGLFAKSFNILGNTTIETTERFWFPVKTRIWEEFKKRGLSKKCGEIFKPIFFWNKMKYGYILSSESSIYFIKKKENIVLNKEQVYSAEFSKEHFYNFTGTLELQGRRVDARKGEGGNVDITLPKMRKKKSKRLIKDIEAAKSSSHVMTEDD